MVQQLEAARQRELTFSLEASEVIARVKSEMYEHDAAREALRERQRLAKETQAQIVELMRVKQKLIEVSVCVPL